MSTAARYDPNIANLPSLYTVVDTMSVDTSKDWTILSKYSRVDDPTINTVFAVGGSIAYEHVIGSATHVPTVAGTTTNWGADTAYASKSLQVVVCGAIGGYDTVVNQTGGGTILANHCMVKYSVGGHSYIFGGSICVVAGTREAIVASYDSELGPLTSYAFIATSNNCELQTSNYGTIISSCNCDIAGDYNACLSSYDVTSTVAASRNLLAAANNVDVSGSTQYCVVTGLNNTVVGVQHGLLIGSNSNLKHSYSSLIGNGGESPSVYSQTIAQKIWEQNDCRNFVKLDSKRTTNATVSNLTNGGIQLPAGKITAGLLRVKIVAMQDGSADGDATGLFAMAIWTADIGFRWDGTNGYLFTGATTAGPSASPTINIPVLKDDIGCAALPLLAISAGLPRIQVTGKASTTINWVCTYEILHTLAS